MYDNTTWKPKELNPAKQYLMEYRTLVRRRDTLVEELDRLREGTVRATSRLSATRLSGTGSHGGMEDSAIGIVDGEEALRRTIEHIDECLAARLVLIEQLTDERQKLILTYRYIKGMGWDKIGQKLYYSRSYLLNHHGYALVAINRLLKD